MLSEQHVDDRQLFATTIQVKIDLENHYKARRKYKSFLICNQDLEIKEIVRRASSFCES